MNDADLVVPRGSIFGSKYLPDGSHLTDDETARRARIIEFVVWAHFPILVAVAALGPQTLRHGLVDIAPILTVAV